MKKQPEITERTKQNLVNAFCELYLQKPVEKISISEITTSAGYHRSTFYQYFVDIYDILEYIENDVLNYIKIQANEQSDISKMPNVNNLLLLFKEKEKYLSSLLGEYGSFHFLNRLKSEVILNNKDIFSPEFSSIAPYIMEFHLSTSVSLLQLWLKRKKDLSSDELSDLIHTLFTTGISSILNPKSD